MQAIIISGGKGERLGALTDKSPKGMIKVNNKPILEYQIEWLKSHGVKRIIFACGYLHEQIRDYFSGGKKFALEIDYSVEAEPLGRGGALKKVWNMLYGNETIIVTNGDIYTEMNLTKAIDMHKKNNIQKGIKGTVCLFPYKSSYGVVKIDKENLIESFEEKPLLPYWINGGVYIFEHDIKNYLPDVGDHETTAFPKLLKEKMLYGYACSSEFWQSIDTVKDINEFSKYVNEKLLVK